MTNDSINKNIKLTFAGFFLSGFFVLAVGSIIPEFIKNLNLSYSEAGSILSMFALGNLLSNFVFPIISSRFGNKVGSATVILTIPIGFLFIGLFGSQFAILLPIIFLIMGIGRGAISIISNLLINDLSVNKTKNINLLHTIWAFGAFLSPFVIGQMKQYLSFNGVILSLIIITTLMWSCYIFIDYEYNLNTVDQQNKKRKIEIKSRKMDIYFYSVAIFMFFYLGLENTVTGWLMTYLEDMTIISENLSATIVSLTWLMIMIGRIFTAYNSDKYEGNNIVLVFVIGISIMVVSLLLSTNQWTVLIASLIMGFFISAIYPTSISNVSEYVAGNQKTMAILLTSAAIGGMITPKLIGYVADKTSISFAMNIILINIIAMIIFAGLSKFIHTKAN